jgi:uncharacterized damage-inducible protein DinB
MPDIRRLFDYDHWANREALASLVAAGSPPPAALKRMAHIVAAEALWLARLKRRSAPLAVWPELSLSQCATWLGDVEREWKGYLAILTPERLAEQVKYANSKGESFGNTVEDILTHVVLHSAYHRGQIAADVRTAGHQPAYTDFIHAVRTQHIG